MHTRVNVLPKPAQPKNTLPSPLIYLAEHFAAAMLPRPTTALKQQNDCRHIDCKHVPEEVWAALDHAYPDAPVTRANLAQRLSVLMSIADWRFCKCYRHGSTAEHRFIYRLVDTCAANVAADARELSYQPCVSNARAI